MEQASFDQSAAFDQRIDRGALVARARHIVLCRRKRIELFGASMFREAAWDMLLALYLASDGQRLTIGRLTNAAGAPTTTVLRWINYLVDHQLVVRESHPTDARAVFIELTDKGKSLIELYLYETLTIGQ
jgi:DNA-binding MarR family transcriptional regulator